MYQNRRDNNRDGFNRYSSRPEQPRRNPLPEGFSLFYIAISCPEPIELRVKEYKDYLNEKYGCRAAAKSPSHITIIPPFRAEDDMSTKLNDFVQTFNVGMLPVDITLKGYGNFGDRVLFIDVEKNESLHALEQEAAKDFNEQFPSITFGMKPDFNPHVTLATRDIPEGKLQEALSYFQLNHPFEESFNAKDLQLFQLVKGWWQQL